MKFPTLEHTKYDFPALEPNNFYFLSVETTELMGSRGLPENVQNQGNIFFIWGNTGTREPGTKKGNIWGIPVFFGKWRTSR